MMERNQETAYKKKIRNYSIEQFFLTMNIRYYLFSVQKKGTIYFEQIFSSISYIKTTKL